MFNYLKSGENCREEIENDLSPKVVNRSRKPQSVWTMEDPSLALDRAAANYAERPFSFFRSERMAKISVTLPVADRALQIAAVRALGNAEVCQFSDVSSPAPAAPWCPGSAAPC